MVLHATSTCPVIPDVKLGVTPPVLVGLAVIFSCASKASSAAWLDEPLTE